MKSHVVLNPDEMIRKNITSQVVVTLRDRPVLYQVDFALSPRMWSNLEEEMLTWKHPRFRIGTLSESVM